MATSWFHSLRKHDRAALRKQERRRRLQVESLEGRQLLSGNSIVVNSTADSTASGTLRYAITQVDTPGSGYNQITFNLIPPGSGYQAETINLNSALPPITQPVTIVGTLPSGAPGVVLNGANAGSSAVGLQLNSANVEVEGLVVDSFGGGGIQVHGSSAQITGDYIGVNAAGTAAAPNGGYGLQITSQASGATVSGDTISGNNGDGIEIQGATGVNVSTVAIGTDPTGLHALGNTYEGVVISAGATNNTIGPNDTISANGVYGVRITGSGTTGNVVEGDYIGTDKTGGVALGNGYIGVLINGGAANNTVGVTTTGTADVISGNTVYGVYISDSGTSGNVVDGDFIGTNATGSTGTGTDGRSLGNDDGVEVAYSATNNTIGGTSVAARNVISGNSGDGVQVSTSGSGNVVEGDYIGTNAGGNAAIANGRSGVTLQYGAVGTTVGGTVPGSANVISGNGVYGVWILSSSSDVVEGDFIGTGASGNYAVGNAGTGVWVSGGSTNNTIGGTSAAARDVISGNATWGVYITDSGTTGNVVEGDYIGTDSSGNYMLANGYNGVDLVSGATYNTVGGTTAAARNIISGNANNGVVIAFSGASSNTVEGNWIGLGAAGNVLPNLVDGVIIQGGATNNTIGGTASGTPNVISGNLQQGVLITDSGTSGNLVEGDYVGTDPTGNYGTDHNGNFLGNRAHGVLITNGATSNTVGGTTVGARDVVSNNSYNGVALSGSTTSYNLVEGDYIGTNAGGSAALGNGANGVFFSGAPSNTVGGTTAGARDVISGNGSNGVWIASGSQEVVEGDYIGTDYTGKVAVANLTDGVLISQGSTSNIIGGTVAGSLDVISGNSNAGVVISDSGTTGNGVYGDYIGTDVTGSNRLANHFGVQVLYGASSNTIGTVGGRNVISGNGWDGVQLLYSGTSNNTVQDDNIGTNAAGNAPLGNGGSGVAVAGSASGNNIDYSVISGNAYNGVYISDSGTTGNYVSGDYIGTDGSGTFAVSNGTNGVILQSGASGNYVLFSTVSGNLEDGILLQGANYNGVEYVNVGVNAWGSAVVLPTGRPYSNYDGLQINGGSYGNYVAANTISGNDTGVEIDGSASGNSIVNNAIGTVTYSLNGGTFGNVQYDVYLLGTSGNTVDYNTIANAGVVGILFQSSPNQDGGHNTFSNNFRANEQFE
jgi:parallel beta-helix repeat protein